MPTFYGAIDLSKNELRNAVVQNLASPPTGQQGQLYFDSTAKILYWHNGTTWVSASGATPATSVTTEAVGNAAVVGTSLNYARQDHVHGREGFGSVSGQTNYGSSPADGTALTVSHSDHQHGTVGLQSLAGNIGTERIGATASAGTDTLPSRADHVHPWAASIANLDMGNFAIVNLANPTNGTDGVNKNYVDNLTQGLSWKQAVRAYGAANITLSGIPSSALTDGVTLVAGDRVLLNNQSTPSQNGIYIAASGAWSRATDADAGAELVNATVYISEGTTYADTQWTCVTNAPITIGSTTIQFQQIAGAGTYNWGNGLSNVGNQINVNPGNGIVITSDNVTVQAADTSITVGAGGVQVNTGVIATVASVSAGYQPIDTDLTALAALATTGLIVRTGAGTVASRSIVGTAPITVTNGDGVAGNPTVAVNNFTAGAAGTVPASGGGSTTFLRADGAWASPPGTGLAKFTATLTGTASPEVVTHNLNTRDVMVTVLNGASPYTAVEVDWDATTVNTVTIRYNPNLGAGYRCVVVG